MHTTQIHESIHILRIYKTRISQQLRVLHRSDKPQVKMKHIGLSVQRFSTTYVTASVYVFCCRPLALNTETLVPLGPGRIRWRLSSNNWNQFYLPLPNVLETRLPTIQHSLWTSKLRRYFVSSAVESARYPQTQSFSDGANSARFYHQFCPICFG